MADAQLEWNRNSIRDMRTFLNLPDRDISYNDGGTEGLTLSVNIETIPELGGVLVAEEGDIIAKNEEDQYYVIPQE